MTAHLNRLLSPLLVVALTPVVAGATTVVHLPLPKLTRLADVIVDARVKQTTCHRQGKMLFTHVTVKVSTWYKGTRSVQTQATLKLRVPGGKLGQDRLVVVGMPTFRVGERVLLFLRRQPRFYWPLGLQQGKFTISRDRRGRLAARRDFGGTSFLRLSGSPPGRLDYLQVVRQVRRYIPKRATP